MKWLTKRMIWTNTKLGLLKICCISGGSCIGSLMVPFVDRYSMYFLFGCVVTGLATLTWWIGKMKKKSELQAPWK